MCHCFNSARPTIFFIGEELELADGVTLSVPVSDHEVECAIHASHHFERDYLVCFNLVVSAVLRVRSLLHHVIEVDAFVGLYDQGIVVIRFEPTLRQLVDLEHQGILLLDYVLFFRLLEPFYLDWMLLKLFLVCDASFSVLLVQVQYTSERIVAIEFEQNLLPPLEVVRKILVLVRINVLKLLD